MCLKLLLFSRACRIPFKVRVSDQFKAVYLTTALSITSEQSYVIFEGTDPLLRTMAQEYTTASSMLHIRELCTAFHFLYHQSPGGWTREAPSSATGAGSQDKKHSDPILRVSKYIIGRDVGLECA